MRRCVQCLNGIESKKAKCKKCGFPKKNCKDSKDDKYNEPNPAKKNDINTWLAVQEYLPGGGKAVILDAGGMKTTRALCAANKFTPDQIVIPEYATDTFEENSKDLSLIHISEPTRPY